MAIALTKINSFTEKLAKKLIDLSGSGLTVALTNTAHTSTWSQLSELTQVSYTYCSSRVCTVTSCTQTSGTLKLVLQDLTLTASGGSVGPYQYVYLFDDASTNDLLIGYYNIGSAVTLADGDQYVLNFDDSNGVLTIA